ncbi:hypothetical protein C0J52_09487 [Blattella germanica]|nr:hypothetical protein C0J52_09487 [Blattella germanica]
MHLQVEEYMSWNQVLRPIEDSKVDEYAAWLCDDLHLSNNSHLKVEELSDWYYKAAVFENMQCQVYQQLYQMIDDTEYESSLPLFIDSEQILKKDKSILDALSISLIKSYILNAEKDYWSILYSSSVHGISLLSLVEHIQKKGPTLLVIKDNGNYIFGGYASESWKPEVAKFYGDPTSFLYTLHPKMNIYRASGRNKNYQYLAFRKRNIPNGLGFGGSEGNFTLWIDQDGMSGETNIRCSTYVDVPRLSSHKKFIIVQMEVWGFGLNGHQFGTRPHRSKSILETEGIFDPTAVFGLTGKPFHSQNFHEVGRSSKCQLIFSIS